MRCTDILMRDHRFLLRGLDILDEMAAKIDVERPVKAEDVESLLRFLRVFGDDHHQTKEESALFPVLVSCCPAERTAFRQMLFEHDQERSLIEGLEDALRTKKGMDFVHYALRLSSLLRNHIYKEDNILFDIIEKSLTNEQDEKVVAEFQKYDEALESEIGGGLLNELRRLERTYLGRAA